MVVSLMDEVWYQDPGMGTGYHVYVKMLARSDYMQVDFLQYSSDRNEGRF